MQSADKDKNTAQCKIFNFPIYCFEFKVCLMNSNMEYSLKGRWHLLLNKKIVTVLWVLLPLIAVIGHINDNSINNYVIYRNVFHHTVDQSNLYQAYADQWGDLNHYGPFFSLVIMPFAILPDKIGVVCWVLANAGFLFWAIRKLKIPETWKTAVLLLCLNELLYTSGQVQANALICGCILLTFIYIEEEKEYLAALFIIGGALIKIYPIIGLAFFLFSRHRIKFFLWLLTWLIIFFLAPMVISSWPFIIRSYSEWYYSLLEKSAMNIRLVEASMDQDVSVMGMIRRLFHLTRLSDYFILAPCAFLFCCQYLRYKYFNDMRFRFYILCSVLIFTVIFSNGAEAATYIIALPGMCLWFLFQPKTKKNIIFFGLIFFFTTFLYSDIFISHSFRREFAKPYSLKALCPFILWITILVQVYTKQFLKALYPVQAR